MSESKLKTGEREVGTEWVEVVPEREAKRGLTLANVGGGDVRFRGAGEDGRGRRLASGDSTKLDTSAGVEARVEAAPQEGAEAPRAVVEFVETLG